jgi:hypothetical protein
MSGGFPSTTAVADAVRTRKGLSENSSRDDRGGLAKALSRVSWFAITR